MPVRRLLILGCGYTGVRVARLGAACGLTVVATVRTAERAAALSGEPCQLLVAPRLGPEIAQHVDAQTHVVITFPADPTTDPSIAPALGGAHSIAYISSTGVYGELRGPLDDATPLPPEPDERGARLLAAEAAYRAAGASVLRAAAIYGPDRGLHMRVLRGEHRIPGDGTRMLSRIHAEDLAQFCLAAGEHPADTFVIGDEAPAPQIEVVRFICEQYRVAMPPHAELADVHASLRADRAVDSIRARQQLGVTLRYPNYRAGMSPAATGIAPRA
jgi:nucleoside-diphosphate-sugar epimerase